MINNKYQKRVDGVVLNNDLKDYERFRMQRQKVVQEKSLHQKVLQLETEVKELKSIISKLIG